MSGTASVTAWQRHKSFEATMPTQGVRTTDMGIHDTNPNQVGDNFSRYRARLEVVRQVAGVDPQPLDRPSLTRISIECFAPL